MSCGGGRGASYYIPCLATWVWRDSAGAGSKRQRGAERRHDAEQEKEGRYHGIVPAYGEINFMRGSEQKVTARRAQETLIRSIIQRGASRSSRRVKQYQRLAVTLESEHRSNEKLHEPLEKKALWEWPISAKSRLNKSKSTSEAGPPLADNPQLRSF